MHQQGAGRPYTLTLIYMQGCPYCDEAKGWLRELEQANPGLRVRKVDIDTVRLPFPVPVFPAFHLETPSGRTHYTDAQMMGGSERVSLVKWLRQVAQTERAS